MERDLLARLDVRAAMLEEAAHPPFLLPARHIEDALGGRLAATVETSSEPPIDDLARHCLGVYRRDQQAHAVEVASTLKSPKGHRPVHVLSFEQRVLYRALVDNLESPRPAADRSDQAWTSFQEGPLQYATYRYIVRTDVVGCYQYIDHDVLLDELVARTGNADIADEIGRFLGTTVGRRGLPQNVGPSHVLAEYYLDAAERALLRSGHPTWRFSDDFMIAGDSWSRINSALDDLWQQLRRIGLVLNEEKTRFFRQETYSKWIRDPLERLQAAGGQAVLAAVADYDPDEPPDDEGRNLELLAEEGAAVELLERSLSMHRSDRPADRLDVTINRKVARGALRLLGLVGSLGAVRLVDDLLRFEPQLTPSVAQYLTHASAADNQDEVRETVSQIVTDASLYISPWQATWLMQPLLKTGEAFDTGILEWLRGMLLSPLSLARARAAEVLAWPDQIEPVDITRLYAAAPPASRPDFAAAIALRCWDKDAAPVRAITRESPFNALVVNTILP